MAKFLTSILWGKNGKSYRNKTLLNDFLTQEEIEKFNKCANELWSEANNKRRFEKAAKIKKEDYFGFVFVEGAGYNDGFFDSLDDFYDWLENEYDGECKFEYAWACESRPCLNLNADQIIESATEEAYEDFDVTGLKGVEDFKKAVEKFAELNKDYVSYYPDYSRAILLK